MTMYIYIAVAITFLILILSLLRMTNSRSRESDEYLQENHPAPSTGNGRWLDLSERIFDPSDARWLRDELAFPKLAKLLTFERRRLAIRWLQAMQASFDELVRTPETCPSGDPEAPSLSGWRMLWLIVRFKLVIAYALLVVRLFGPYHRLIPSFSWISFSRESGRSFHRADLVDSRSSQ
jgi:hypothetical protein